MVVAAVVAGAVAIANMRSFGAENDDGHSATSHAPSGSSSQGQSIDPSKFAAGSCIAYAPTEGNRDETVFLDAGHGGIDPGGVGTTENGSTIYESDATLPVELDAMALLRAQGFRVVVSRTGDSTVLRLRPGDVSDQLLTNQGVHDEVAARDECANDAKAKVLVGIYFNASNSTQSAGSVTAYDPARPFSSANLTLANLVQNDVLTSLNAQGWAIPNDGVQPDSGFGSLSGDPDAGGLAGEAAAYDHLMLIGPAMPGFYTTPSEMPGVIIEPLYITDPFEGSIASSANGQGAIARGIASAVEQFLAPQPASKSKNLMPKPLIPLGN
jgi:N-acetylmuramoyl-L-alanine amidase